MRRVYILIAIIFLPFQLASQTISYELAGSVRSGYFSSFHSFRPDYFVLQAYNIPLEAKCGYIINNGAYFSFGINNRFYIEKLPKLKLDVGLFYINSPSYFKSNMIGNNACKYDSVIDANRAMGRESDVEFRLKELYGDYDFQITIPIMFLLNLKQFNIGITFDLINYVSGRDTQKGFLRNLQKSNYLGLVGEYNSGFLNSRLRFYSEFTVQFNNGFTDNFKFDFFKVGGGVSFILIKPKLK